MTISFHIEYHTGWGEEVKVTGSIPELGEWHSGKALALQTVDGINWQAGIEIEVSESPAIMQYRYCIFREGKVIREEQDNPPRCVILPSGSHEKRHIHDCWRDSSGQPYFYSSAFTEAIFARKRRDTPPARHKKSVLIKACTPRIPEGYSVGICGNQEMLGNWNSDKAWPMSDNNFPEWQAELDAGKLRFPLEYKFILYDKKGKKSVLWEDGSNRHLAETAVNDGETVIITDECVHFDVPDWKGAGVAIPVFSLRSEKSFGIGDFGDLKKMIDWAVSTGQKIVQLLPVYDTTATNTRKDSYPYNSISVYALHPLYIDLNEPGELHDKQKQAYFAARQKELNASPTVNYEEVNRIKREYLRLIFLQEGERTLASDEYRDFFDENKEWLVPYAAFCYLRDLHETANFREWPRFRVYNREEIEQLCRPGTEIYPEIALSYYIQFHLHTQLKEVASYARSHRVALKGDIPIGISKNSVDVWTEPRYFNTNGQAGAPPDDFSVNGQNWGFPTYNWDEMEKDGFQWWVKRLKKMTEYFDSYRIDHILGFFRIWEIPANAVHALLGQFVPAIPMGRDEIESFGLPFKDDLYLTPYIDKPVLRQIFGAQAEYVRQKFTEPKDAAGMYRMKPEFDTQRKVESYFLDKTDSNSGWIRDGLYSLISNVLFVRDNENSGKYHPRVGAQRDYTYRLLTDVEKDAFNEVYNHFYHRRHNEFWRLNAMKKLRELTRSTRMLVCGEDLGMIPESVNQVMNDLHILSLEIQRMPKTPGLEFGHPHDNPYRSVSTISTHDMSTLRGWWEEDREKTQRYYNDVMGHPGEAPETASAKLCEEVVRSHLQGSSMLCILSFQDWTSIDEQRRNPDVPGERINIPANPKHYWCYRMHMTLEELIIAQSLNRKIKKLISQSGRNG